MANGTIDVNGLSDRSVYMQVAANIAGAYENYGTSSGNYPKIDTIMGNRILNDIWTANYLDARIFVDGLGVKSVTSMDTRALAVRVPLIAPPPFAPRTIAVDTHAGAGAGTPGNDGVENINLPNVPQTNGVEVTFNQVYDQATVFHRLTQNTLTLDIMGEYNKMIPQAVANMTDSSIIAQQLNHGLYRAATTSNSNLIGVDLTTATRGSLQLAMNQLIGFMTNPQTDWSEGVVQYPLEGCVILMKQSLWNSFFTVEQGAIINSNVGQEMLLGGAFTKDGRAKGNNVRGEYSGVLIKVVPDSYFKNAAAYLGLTGAAATNFGKVLAYICHRDGTAFGRVDTSINPIPNPGNSIGVKVQNNWQWGVNVVRSSSIGILVEGAASAFTNPITTLKDLVAPTSFGAAYGGTLSVGVTQGA